MLNLGFLLLTMLMSVKAVLYQDQLDDIYQQHIGIPAMVATFNANHLVATKKNVVAVITRNRLSNRYQLSEEILKIGSHKEGFYSVCKSMVRLYNVDGVLSAEYPWISTGNVRDVVVDKAKMYILDGGITAIDLVGGKSKRFDVKGDRLVLADHLYVINQHKASVSVQRLNADGMLIF
jgi:hypothetical protein